MRLGLSRLGPRASLFSCAEELLASLNGGHCRPLPPLARTLSSSDSALMAVSFAEIGRLRILFLVSAYIVHSAQCCHWGWRLNKFGDVLADTVVEFSDARDSVEDGVLWRALGKASAYGGCPPSEDSAKKRMLHKSVLRLHSEYDAVDDLLPADACHPIEPAWGGVLWVLRGKCNFINKTVIAKQAGASAVLIGNAGKRKRTDSELVAISCPEGQEEACESSLTTGQIIACRHVCRT